MDDLVNHCIHLLRAYAQDRSTHQLKALAPLIVELRSRHSLKNGLPDWSGRSPEYRADMHWIYAEARIPADQLDTVQAALRYHVGNLLRERASLLDLEAVGLKATSPKERLAKVRTDNAWRRRCTCACTCGAQPLSNTVEIPSLWS